MKLTNKTMEEYLTALGAISDKVTGKFAYAVARNMRKLSDNLIEYMVVKKKAIREYGERTENGDSRIKIGTEAFNKFAAEMEQYLTIEHDVDLMMVSQEDVSNSTLNATEILSIDFMMEDDKDE